MEENNNKALSFLERMKQKVEEQKQTDEVYHSTAPKIDATTCTNCGAGRTKMDGLTKCAYCGFEFMNVELTEGLNIKKEDNSR